VEASTRQLGGALQSEINALLQSETGQANIARDSVARLTEALDRLKRRVLDAEAGRSRLAGLEGEVAAERGVYISLLQRFRGLDNVAALSRSEATVLSPAPVPPIASSPRLGLFAGFGACLFAGLSAGAVVWRQGAKDVVRHTDDAVDLGIVYVPEERQRQGAVLGLPIFQNVSLPSLGKTSRKGFLRLAEEFRMARDYTSRLDLRAASLDRDIRTLSGGNQQKVVIAKWLATKPKVIILDEPTKGIDIGSKAAVHDFIGELAEEGLAVILVTSELPEALGLADRIIVMQEGRRVAEFERGAPDWSAEHVVAAATGAPVRPHEAEGLGR
jgi:ABC-type cobalamin/Fe3+-siderophores transport system ATPase subunit